MLLFVFREQPDVVPRQVDFSILRILILLAETSQLRSVGTLVFDVVMQEIYPLLVVLARTHHDFKFIGDPAFFCVDSTDSKHKYAKRQQQ